MKIFPNNQQAAGKSTCGPVCLLNIYTHFGVKTTLRKIIKEIGANENNSTYPGQLAEHLLSNGLETLLVTASPQSVAPDWKNRQNHFISERLKMWLSRNRSHKWYRGNKHILDYLGKNGRMEIIDLTTMVIDRYLDDGWVILSCLEDSWIWGKRKLKGKAVFDDVKGGARGHFVIVYGKSGNRYLISDPYPTGLPGRNGLYSLEKDKLLVATLVWSATVVAVKKGIGL